MGEYKGYKSKVYTEPVYAVAMCKPNTAKGDIIPENHEMFPCFTEYSQAVKYIRSVQKNPPEHLKPMGNQQTAPVGCIFKPTVTPEEFNLCKTLPGHKIELHPMSYQWYNVETLIFGADKHNKRAVMHLPKDDQARRNKIQEALNKRALPFKGAPRPKFTYDNNPLHVVYMVTHICSEDYKAPFDGIKIHQNTGFIQTLSQAMQAAHVATASPSEEKAYSANDTKHKFGISLPSVCVITPIRLPVELYNHYVHTSKPGDNYFGRVDFLYDHHFQRVGNSKTDVYKPEGMPFVVIGQSAGGPATVITPENHTYDSFCHIVVTELTQRQERATQEADAYHAAMTQQHTPIPYRSAAEMSVITNDQEIANYSVNAGYKLINRWANALSDKEYCDAAKELVVTYQRNVERLHDYTGETKRSAYQAMEKVFSKVQREAAKKGDFITATAAQQIARSAHNALEEMSGMQQNSHGISREQAYENYGIYVPEEEEVTV